MSGPPTNPGRLTAAAADLRLLPGRWRLGAAYAEPRSWEFPVRETALTWLEREQPTLMAIAQQAHRLERHNLTWQIIEAMWALFLHRKHYQQ